MRRDICAYMIGPKVPRHHVEVVHNLLGLEQARGPLINQPIIMRRCSRSLLMLKKRNWRNKCLKFVSPVTKADAVLLVDGRLFQT